MKAVKILLLTVAVLAAAFTGALLFVTMTLDPNDYKQELEAAVERATGLKLRIEDDIGLTFSPTPYPALALDARRVLLDDPAKSGQHLASAEYVLMRLKLTPLLRRRVEIEKIASEIRLHEGTLLEEPLDVSISADVTTDLAANRIVIPRLSADAAGVHVGGNAQITDPFGDAQATADVKIKRDPFDLPARVHAGKRKIKVDALPTKIFGGDFSGELTMDAGSKTEPRKWRSRGEARGVELERVLAAFDVADGKALKGAGDLSWRLTATGDEKQSLLRSLSGPVQAKLKIFGGDFNGELTMDAGSKAEPRKWRSRGEARGVELEQVLAAFDVADGKALKGAGDLSWRLTATGDEKQPLLRSLSGPVQVELRKGALKNPELARAVERIVAFFEKRPPGKTGTELIIERASATLSLKNGVAENRDLEAEMPLVHVTGAGEADLVRSRLNYELRVGLLSQKPEQRVYIPLRVTGALDDPRYSLDLAKAAREQAEREIRRRVTEEKERVREKAEGKKENIKEKIRDKLDEILQGGLKLPL